MEENNKDNLAHEEVDFIGEMQLKTSSEELTLEEQLETDKWEAINAYKNKRNKKKFAFLLLVLLIVLAVFLSTIFTNEYKDYETKKELNFGADQILTIANIKTKSIKTLSSPSNRYVIKYRFLNNKDLDEYSEFLLSKNYYSGQNKDNKIFVKESSENNNYLFVEFLNDAKTIIYYKKRIHISEIDLDIFKSKFKSDNLVKIEDNPIGTLLLDKNFEKKYRSDDLMVYNGDIIKQLRLYKEEKNMEKESFIQTNITKLEGLAFEIVKEEEKDDYIRIDAYNKNQLIWISSFIFIADDSYRIIELTKINQNDYIDKLIINFKY